MLADRLRNLTNGLCFIIFFKIKIIIFLEELNANNYNPIKGLGENGKAVNLNIKHDLESEKTFGINQVKIIYNH